MRQAVLFSILLFSSWSAAQYCTAYVVVNVYNPGLSIDILTLKAEDFQAKIDGTSLPIVSSKQNYSSRLLVLLETDGIGDNSQAAEAVDTVTRMARQAPEGQPIAFGVYADRAVFTKGFFDHEKERTTAINAVREEASSLGKRVALFDALHQALQLFGPHQPGDALLLVGYPYDDKSRHSASDVEKKFLATSTRFMAMLREPLNRVTRDFLINPHTAEKTMFDALPAKTGGAPTGFDPHFFGWGWRGYLLEIKIPDGLRRSKSGKWKLQFRGTAADAFKKSKLYYPELLPPCASLPADAR
jgi:hypothetical protein